MTFYEKAKDWLKQKENKQKLVFGLSFILVFIVGFGAGSFRPQTRRDVYKPQTNYTTNQPKKPVTAAADNQPQVLAESTTKTATGTPAAACPIKGNIAAGGKKIFHLKGGAFYDRTKAELCFNTEAEALAAGFVKSSR